jgi:hypothetical protein
VGKLVITGLAKNGAGLKKPQLVLQGTSLFIRSLGTFKPKRFSGEVVPHGAADRSGFREAHLPKLATTGAVVFGACSVGGRRSGRAPAFIS